MRRSAGFLIALALTACGDGREAVGTESPQAPPQRPLRDVLDAELKKRGLRVRRDVGNSRELRDDTGVLPPGVEVDPGPPAIAADARSATVEEEPVSAQSPPPLDPGLVEFRDGMVELLLSTPDALKRAQGDIEGVGAEMLPVLVRGLQDDERPALERKALIDLGAALPSAEMAAVLCEVAADAEEAWLRRYAVWALEVHRSAEGADAIVPRLLLRLKYEPDGEALGWILRTLWGYGYPAALERARARAESLGDAAGRASLQASLAGYDGLEPPAEPTPSQALLGETWLWISDLSGAHFQLRGVDDARYVLSTLGPWAGAVLAEALEDDDDYVRLHTAQVLERMGPRGRSAAGSLGAALEDPNGAVRGAAAEALVAVAGDEAGPRLLARLGAAPPVPYEDRVALSRAIANLPTPPSSRLREVFDSSPGDDLRLACAGGLLRTGDDAALEWILDRIRSSSGDPAGAEATIGRWLAGPASEVEGLLEPAAALEAWTAHDAGGAVIHSAAQAGARRRARAAAIERLRTLGDQPDPREDH